MNPPIAKMKAHQTLVLALGALVSFPGCVRNYYQQDPQPAHVLQPSTNPSWTEEKEKKLQNLLGELERLRAEQAKPQPPPAPTVTEPELAALKEENARRREKINFLTGEINALLIERGNKPLPYTSNSQ